MTTQCSYEKEKLSNGRRANPILKRCLDLLMSIVALVVLSIPLAIIGLLVWIDSGWPVIFVQERVGLRGRTFKIYKFRTMAKDAVNVGMGLRTSKDDPRITRVGRFLREYHLDELPQIINVLIGDMSIVGPRPTIPSQVRTYTPFEMRRLEVRPGITGLAQVSGNNELPWEERIKLDVYYVDHASLLLDLNIIVKTIFTVLKRRGVYGTDGIVHDKEEPLAK